MRRVLFVTSYDFCDPSYPGGNWVLTAASALAGSGWCEVALAFLSQKCRQKWAQGSLTFYPIYNKVPLVQKIAWRLTNTPEIYKEAGTINEIVSEFNPDIVQLYGMETSAGELPLLIDKPVPIIVHLQGVLSEYVKSWYPDCIDPTAIRNRFPLKARLTRTTDPDFFKRVKKRASIEESDFRRYIYYFGRTKWDASVVATYAPGAKYYHCDELLRPEFQEVVWKRQDRSEIIISSVINGEMYKGYDNILRCAIELRSRGVDFTWNVYGVDDNAPILRLYELSLGAAFIDNQVFFKGKASANVLASELSKSDVFVHPSHIDNSPNALCEAMMVGVPSIAMGVGGVPSILCDGIEGYIVEDNNVNDLASKIINIKSNSTQAESFSRLARQRAEKRNAVETVLEQLSFAYNEILGQ